MSKTGMRFLWPPERTAFSNLASTCWLTLGHPKAATGHPERAELFSASTRKRERWMFS
jgi:hypothetical protein